MLRQVHFVKGVKRCTKKRNLNAIVVKDLNAFINDKVDEILKEHDNALHMVSDFKERLISSSNKSGQSIIRKTSVIASNNKDCKPVAKK
eukprot:11078233-Ditylum_brightwellii.AAC.1